MSFANSDLCSVWIYFSIEKIRSLSALLFGRTRHARVNLDKLGYLGYLGNNSFISHISPQKVATSEKLTKHNVQNEDSLSSEGRKNWKSFIQSAWNLQLYFFFFALRLVQTKTSFLLGLTWQKWFPITYKSNMKTTHQSFQMIAHCLFTSIDSNEKSREIRMRVIVG
jgi:hypothetical protein